MNPASTTTAPTDSPTGKNCWKCAAPIHRIGQKFCTKCAARLDQGDSASAVAIAPSPVDAADVLARRLERYQVSRSLRESYFQLGLQLLDDGRFEPAMEALQQALREEGPSPEQPDALIALARACESAEERGPALRAYLEAIAEGFEPLDMALAKAATLLSPATALAHGEWVDRDWAPHMRGSGTIAATRARLLTFRGIVQLCLGRDDQTIELLTAAAAVDAVTARNAAAEFLGSATLPVALTANTGEAHYGLARIFQALGDREKALSHASEALEIGLAETHRYPEAPVQKLRAELLEQSGDRVQAAKWFYEAGCRYSWRNDFQDAIDALRRSISLDPTQVSGHWALAECLLRWSFENPRDREVAPGSSPVELDQEGREEVRVWQRRLAEEALAAWDKGFAVRAPQTEDAWAYATRAFIAKRLGDLGPAESREEALWEAVLYVERSLVRDASDAYPWGALCELYGDVSMEQCRLQAAMCWREVAPEDPAALLELSNDLLRLGEFDQAKDVVDKLRNLRSDPWADLAAARLLLYTGRYADAAVAVTKAVEDAPEVLAFGTWLALIYGAMGETDRMTELYRSIWQRYPPKDRRMQEELTSFGLAGYAIGEPEKAIELFKMELEITGPAGRGAGLRNLGLSYLAAGRTEEARVAFGEGVELMTNTEDVLLFRFDLDDAARRAPSWPNAKVANELLAEVRGKIEAKSRAISTPRSAEDELREVLAALPPAIGARSWAAIAARAGLARLHLQTGRLREAGEEYRSLLTDPEPFPEAAHGLGRIVEESRDAGDACLKRRETKQAIDQYSQALSLVDELLPNQAADRAGLIARAAYASFVLDPRARAELERSLDAYRGQGDADPGKSMADELRGLVPSDADYWDLQDELARLAMDSAPEWKRVGFGRAREALESYLDASYHLGAGDCMSSSNYAMATPVAVVMAKDLIPEGDPEQWPLFKTHLPEMRERIRIETGVNLPGIRIHEDDLPSATYIILLDEIPIVMGSVGSGEAGHAHANPSPERVEALSAPGHAVDRPGSNAHAGHEQNRAPARGAPAWEDAHAFIVHHLEAVLTRNLADFLDAQQVHEMCEEWEKDAEGAAFVHRALPDKEERLRFGHLLRALVRERVPIARWQDILSAVATAGRTSRDVMDTLRSVRLHLKDVLPGNAPSSLQLALPREIEDRLRPWVVTDDGRTFLAIPPEETQQLLTNMREFVISHKEENPVLVVADGELRPFLRRLIEADFPDLMTLSDEERIAAESEPRMPRGEHVASPTSVGGYGAIREG